MWISRSAAGVRSPATGRARGRRSRIRLDRPDVPLESSTRSEECRLAASKRSGSVVKARLSMRGSFARSAADSKSRGLQAMAVHRIAVERHVRVSVSRHRADPPGLPLHDSRQRLVGKASFPSDMPQRESVPEGFSEQVRHQDRAMENAVPGLFDSELGALLRVLGQMLDARVQQAAHPLQHFDARVAEMLAGVLRPDVIQERLDLRSRYVAEEAAAAAC